MHFKSLHFHFHFVVFFRFQVLSFTKSDCLDFIANDECPRNPTSTIGFGGSAGVSSSYYKLQQKPKQFPGVKMHFSWFTCSLCLLQRRNQGGETHWHHRKRLQACLTW